MPPRKYSGWTGEAGRDQIAQRWIQWSRRQAASVNGEHTLEHAGAEEEPAERERREKPATSNRRYASTVRTPPRAQRKKEGEVGQRAVAA